MQQTNRMPARASEVRRVVTGLNEAGRSCVLFDGPVPWLESEDPIKVSQIWGSAVAPADNSGDRDEGFAPFDFSRLADAGYVFCIAEWAPGHGTEDPGMHFTNTVDNIVILAGQLTLVLEDGDVVLGPGDVLITRGHVHGWRNDGDVPAFLLGFNVPARQVSEGTPAF